MVGFTIELPYPYMCRVLMEDTGFLYEVDTDFSKTPQSMFSRFISYVQTKERKAVKEGNQHVVIDL